MNGRLVGSKQKIASIGPAKVFKLAAKSVEEDSFDLNYRLSLISQRFHHALIALFFRKNTGVNFTIFFVDDDVFGCRN
jgi:hypothetical protein